MVSLAIFSNFLNHHQVWVADELYRVLGESFKFIVTCSSNMELKGGENYSNRPYCICACDNMSNKELVKNISKQYSVCIFGACSQEYAIERAKHNPSGLSFEMGERWLKRGWLNICSPVLLRWRLNYLLYYRKANFYKLCMSAFTARDDIKLGCYKGKHYKWGYFTNNTVISKTHTLFSTKKTNILWCSRFINWKHPELAVQLAARLKERNIPFHLNMIGVGDELNTIKHLSIQLGVDDCVSFLGKKSNSEVRNYMSQSDLFIFTSDKNEGWGVVSNEAMNEGCLLIASDQIGAVPFLLTDGETGYIFQSQNINSLTDKVLLAINRIDIAREIAEKGKQNLQNLWSPRSAANNLLLLVNKLLSSDNTEIIDGPCSKSDYN